MARQKITSLQNPGIKEVVKLRDRRQRDQTQRFLIEGYRELLRATQGEVSLELLYICPELFLGENEPTLIQRVETSGAEVVETTSDVFHKISYRDRPDGLICIAKQPHRTLQDLKIPPTSPLFVVAEAIEKPGNLGTILRSCDATKVDGLIVCDRCTDLYNPNVVRASVGTLFTVAVAEAEGKETLRWLKEHRIQILAATPSAKTLYTDADLTGPLAIVIGTEQLGLSKEWMEEADLQVRLPMHGQADSLNVSMATTVLLYEVLRQRSLS